MEWGTRARESGGICSGGLGRGGRESGKMREALERRAVGQQRLRQLHHPVPAYPPQYACIAMRYV
eukprot:714235-Rhodomonas_salina.2